LPVSRKHFPNPSPPSFFDFFFLVGKKKKHIMADDYFVVPLPIHQKRIYLYLIRHGQSQANVSPLLKKATDPYTDPTLTRLGMEQAITDSHAIAKCFHKILRKIRVYTSVLLRAQETALLAFPQSNVNIHVSNHLKEEPNILQRKFERGEGENFPLPSIQAQQFKMRRANINPSRLVYETNLLQPDGFHYRPEVIRTTGNVKRFLHEHADDWRDGEIIVLVIHGHLIRHFLGVPDSTKIPNGGIYQAFDDPIRHTLSIPLHTGEQVQHLLLYHPPQTDRE
jgi:broad specificity phosphatase PhoE